MHKINKRFELCLCKCFQPVVIYFNQGSPSSISAQNQLAPHRVWLSRIALNLMYAALSNRHEMSTHPPRELDNQYTLFQNGGQ